MIIAGGCLATSVGCKQHCLFLDLGSSFLTLNLKRLKIERSLQQIVSNLVSTPFFRVSGPTNSSHIFMNPRQAHFYPPRSIHPCKLGLLSTYVGVRVSASKSWPGFVNGWDACQARLYFVSLYISPIWLLVARLFLWSSNLQQLDRVQTPGNCFSSKINTPAYTYLSDAMCSDSL